jgi:Asp-tRNA(Asn)/Glu-tRNA(Gln) amidotransferase A subunit family amidase
MVAEDNIETAGVRTTYGSRFFADHVPSAAAEVVQAGVAYECVTDWHRRRPTFRN